MLKVEFRLGGRLVRPNDIGKQLERAILQQVQGDISQKLRDVRDPETGQPPTVTFVGRTVDDLSFEVAGSPALIEEVRRRLQ